MSLAAMLADTNTEIGEIAKWLDGQPHAARKDAVFSLDRAGQRALYERAEGASLDADYFAPAALGPLRPVVHFGRNTLPLPGSQKLFKKVFARSASAEAPPFGYNDAPSGWIIGPGYFVVVPTAGNAEWERRGPVVVDYFRVPPGPVPAGWPEVVPNDHGIQFFVYHQTRDYMRRVSQDITIGAAYKGEKALGHFFVLVREEI
jgi:hypothetical protein